MAIVNYCDVRSSYVCIYCRIKKVKFGVYFDSYIHIICYFSKE